MIYNLLRVLKNDLTLYYLIKSKLYEHSATKTDLCVENLVSDLIGYGRRDVLAVLLIMKEAGIITELGEGVKTLDTSQFKVDFIKLEILSVQVEGVIRYLTEKQDNEEEYKYRLMASLPLISKATEEYHEISCNVLPVYETILDLISNSNEEIIILNPFFDKKGFEMIEDELYKKLTKGVTIEIISRFNTKDRCNINIISDFLERIKTHKLKENFIVYEYKINNEHYESSTFHAKALVSDKGQRAYLGSANFTGWGLSEQLELGVLMEDRNALRLYNIIKYLKNKSVIKVIN